MARWGSKTYGIDRFQRFLLNISPQAKREMRQVTEGTGRFIEFDAKINAPVDSGKHRQNIVYEPTDSGLGALISFNMPYSVFLEVGTGGLVEIPEGFEELVAPYKGEGKRYVNLPARPHLVPAWRKYQPYYVQQVKNVFRRILK